jgi:hypothetical protein
VHRDLKPDNMAAVHVIDEGLADVPALRELLAGLVLQVGEAYEEEGYTVRDQGVFRDGDTLVMQLSLERVATIAIVSIDLHL